MDRVVGCHERNHKRLFQFQISDFKFPIVPAMEPLAAIAIVCVLVYCAAQIVWSMRLKTPYVEPDGR